MSDERVQALLREIRRELEGSGRTLEDVAQDVLRESGGEVELALRALGAWPTEDPRPGRRAELRVDLVAVPGLDGRPGRWDAVHSSVSVRATYNVSHAFNVADFFRAGRFLPGQGLVRNPDGTFQPAVPGTHVDAFTIVDPTE